MTEQQLRRWMDASADFYGDMLAMAGFNSETAQPELDRVTEAAGIAPINDGEEMTKDHVRRLYVAIAKRTIELLDKPDTADERQYADKLVSFPGESEANNG